MEKVDSGEPGRHGGSGDNVDDGYDALKGLGLRMRAARKRRNMSLSDLSALSGVSVAMLSHIERGRSMPSLKALQKLRTALGISMVDLFPPAMPAPESPVLRADDRARLVFEEIGLVKEKLSPHETGTLELLLLVVEPGGGSGPEPWTRPGEKAGYLLEGAARLEIAGVPYDLKPGDSFQFDSSQPHRFWCTGADTAKILWIISSDPIAKAVDA